MVFLIGSIQLGMKLASGMMDVSLNYIIWSLLDELRCFNYIYLLIQVCAIC